MAVRRLGWCERRGVVVVVVVVEVACRPRPGQPRRRCTAVEQQRQARFTVSRVTTDSRPHPPHLGI
jgi:hypothetical protein